MDLREEIAAKLQLLLSEASPSVREEVTDWATAQMDKDEPALQDMDVWQALEGLSGADSKVAPDVYLYAASDFASWLAELEHRSSPPS